MQILPAETLHFEEILEIEAASVDRHSSKESLLQELQLSWSRIVVGLVENKVVAFCNYWIVSDEIQILYIATHLKNRRNGYAKQLLTFIIQNRPEEVSLFTLEVRHSNSSAQSLYKSLGFTNVGLRKKYYKDKEDAVLMNLVIEK
jgi:ribosomal-protein-alanine N-acetyltransferase